MTDTFRIPEGDDLSAYIAKLPDGAFVIASGWAEGVEITVAVPGGHESRALPGPVALLSLAGSKSGPLMAVVARAGGDGVLGGELVKARSAGVSIAVVGAVDVAAAEAVGRAAAAPAKAARTGDDAAARVATGESSGSAKPNTWAAIAALPQEDDDETDEAPKYGDRVHHFVFGLCDVMLVRGERMKIRDAKGPGRLREIHLSAIKVLAPTVEDGKRVFKLVKRT